MKIVGAVVDPVALGPRSGAGDDDVGPIALDEGIDLLSILSREQVDGVSSDQARGICDERVDGVICFEKDQLAPGAQAIAQPVRAVAQGSIRDPSAVRADEGEFGTESRQVIDKRNVWPGLSPPVGVLGCADLFKEWGQSGHAFGSVESTVCATRQPFRRSGAALNSTESD